MGTQELALKAILDAIDEFGFKVILYTENGKECGFEIEDWTPRGVDMIHFLDLRDIENPYDPFAVLDELWKVAEYFDPDEETEAHMEGKDFHAAFSYYQAAMEFEGWKKRLEELVESVNKAFKKAVPNLSRSMEFSNNLTYKKILEED